MKKIIIIVVFTFSTKFVGQTLHLYGGSDNNVYLGCLNCSEHDSNSIWNEYGNYGSKYNSNSIWNEYGSYGSERQYSPFNEYALNAPIVVDEEGNFYGYFTVNEYKKPKADFSLAMMIYKFHDLMCSDVNKWYKKIFE